MSNYFDAIVIGSGMSGGWAAKEFCEKGMKTLVLERGRKVEHMKDYPTTNMMPWQFEHYGEIPFLEKQANPIVSKCYAFREDAAHFFVKDNEHPYVQEKPFDWIRGYQTGGKSLMWARQTQRWSQYDFDGPARDGFAVPWPIGYKDLDPWYSHVEKFVGISGNRDGLDTLPDGDFLPSLPLNCIETYFQEKVREHYADRQVIYARCAHLTEPREIHKQQGRAQCQNRDLCQRGCPFGGYFSSNSSTLPWAARTGNLTMQNNTVVHSIIYDDQKGKATGVRVIDAGTKKATEYFAPVIFVCAGALNTNLLLLNSKSKRFPHGLGNENELMGKFIGFHNYRAQVNAEYLGMREVEEKGRRPTSAYLPRFRNVKKQETGFLRGYAAGFGAYRSMDTDGKGLFGEALLNTLSPHPMVTPWKVGSHMMGETIPKETNRVYLHPTLLDAWGIPQLITDISYDENDEKMISDFQEQLSEMFEKAGFTNIKVNDDKRLPGLDIHEMGGVRMGSNPKTSLLNGWNQLHACPNVFVTDGACMTSTSTQNPSLTYMAITARAVDFAVKSLKNGLIR
jgi:choline dehydrogenase-like flavoprotein